MRAFFQVYLLLNHLLLVRCLHCPLLNATSPRNVTAATLRCEDVITLHDGTTFRFNCGAKHDHGGGVSKRCDPPLRKEIRYCQHSSTLHHYYFYTMCVNDTLLLSDNHNNDKSNLVALSYHAMSSFDLSSVNLTSSCTNGSTTRVGLSNNSGLIKSPNWPLSYGSRRETCRWKINVPARKSLKLFYMYLNLEQPIVPRQQVSNNNSYHDNNNGNNNSNNNNRCQQSRDNIDSLTVESWKDGSIVSRQHYCGYNPSFMEHYNHELDTLVLQLTVNRTTSSVSNDTGFVIGVVVGDNVSVDNSWLEQYWWIIPIVLFFCVVIMNCMWKKLNTTHHKHRKQQERAFTSSLNHLPKSISSSRSHPPLGQHRSIGGGGGGGGGGVDNFGVHTDVVKAAVTTKISFSPDIQVLG